MCRGYRDTLDPGEAGVGKGLYHELFGPTHYAFSYAGVHFIALDGTDYLGGKLEYSMPPACLDWLKAYLARVPVGDRLVLLAHEPLFSLPQKAALEAALAGRKVVVTLSGHWHSVTRSTFAGAPEIVGGATSYAWHGDPPSPDDAKAYQVVRVTDGGFESAFGDWAEKYPVTIATPGRWASSTGEVPVKVLFLDPRSEVQSAQIRLADASQEVVALGREGLYRTAEATLDLAALPDGLYDLCVTLRGSGEPFVERQPRLVESGREGRLHPRRAGDAHDAPQQGQRRQHHQGQRRTGRHHAAGDRQGRAVLRPRARQPLAPVQLDRTRQRASA